MGPLRRRRRPAFCSAAWERHNETGCDGYAATKAIRTLILEKALGRLPIIALTANAFAEDREACYAAGMDDVLGKPCTVAVVKACLLRWA